MGDPSTIAFTRFTLGFHVLLDLLWEWETLDVYKRQDYIWNEIVNYESDTNYSTGLAGALELVKQNAGRNTVVVFISDGQPYCSTGEVPEEYYGVAEAQAIRAAGVQIISVLQQVPENELASSQENMENIADMVFSSTDLEGFSAAVNDACLLYTSKPTPVLRR